MDKIISGLDKINNKLTFYMGRVATIFLMIMTAIIVTHVFCRYVLNFSFHWTEETARFLMVWMTFLYFPSAHKQGLNVNVEFAVGWFLKTRYGNIVRIALELIILTMLVYCIKLSFGMIERGSNTYSLSLQIPMYQIYLILPVSFSVTLLCSVEKLLFYIQTLIRGPQKPHETELAGV